MTDIQVFDFGGRKVRTAGTHDAPLFCAADVCAVLGLAGGARNAVAALDADERVLVESTVRRKSEKTPNLNVGPSSIVFVTESGLFSLILGSRKPEAKAFKKWVTSEVLPEIRKRGYYNVLEAQQRKQTEALLAEIFPKLPSKSQPIFRELIAALLKLRREPGTSGSPPWARSLASDVYRWAIRIDGQQEYRRGKNPNPNGSHTDHSMFADFTSEAVRRVVTSGCDFAKISTNWQDWKFKMELVFGAKALQMPIMVPVLTERRTEENVGQLS